MYQPPPSEEEIVTLIQKTFGISKQDARALHLDANQRNKLRKLRDAEERPWHRSEYLQDAAVGWLSRFGYENIKNGDSVLEITEHGIGWRWSSTLSKQQCLENLELWRFHKEMDGVDELLKSSFEKWDREFQSKYGEKP